jgi:Flp pilus assembly protein TadD
MEAYKTWPQEVLDPSRTPITFETRIVDLPSYRPGSDVVSASRLRHKVPKQAQKSYGKGIKFSRKGDHSAAAQELEKAVAADPEFIDAQHQLGVEYSLLGRHEESEARLRHAIALDPVSWRAHHDLGVALARRGDVAAAEPSARRALELSPAEPQAHLFLGWLLTLRPETRAQGMEHVEFAAQTNPVARRVLKIMRQK